MNAAIDTSVRPQTGRALSQFARRRRFLIVLRAFAVFAAVALPLLIGIAFLDRAYPIADGLRHGLSVAAYFLAAFAAWTTSIKLLFGFGGERGIARFLGDADPALGEEVLSAVELGGATEGEEDSPAMRARLQDMVAQRADGVDVKALLPLRRIAGWLMAALLFLAVVVALCLIPALMFSGFFARAALPFANLGRPSDITIVLVNPDPGSRMVPHFEAVPLTVELEGRRADRVILETQSADGDTEKIQMARGKDRRFTSEIEIGEDDVRYRIRAGGAVTPYYTLDARPRPRVVTFNKEYTYPEYSGWPVRQVAEEHGDLSALKGSTVRLEFEADQPISHAELRLSQSVTAAVAAKEAGESEGTDDKESKESDNPEEAGTAEVAESVAPRTVRMEVDGKSLSAELPVDGKYDRYDLVLVARTTTFDDADDHLATIDAQIDQPPVPELVDPVKGRDVGYDDIIALTAGASDDVRLAAVVQGVQINGKGWEEIDLGAADGREFFTEHRWALSGHALEVGDVIATRITARDAFGNEAHSRILRLRVIRGRSLAEKREWVEEEGKVAKAVRQLARAAEDLAKATEEAEKKVKKPEAERDLAEKQEAMKTERAAELAREKADAAFEAVKEALKETPGRTEAKELTAAGEELARMRNQRLGRVEEELEKAEPDYKEAKDDAQNLNWQAQTLAKRLEAFTAEDAAEVAKENLERLKDQQEQIAKEASQKKPEETEALAERERAAMEAAETAREDLQEVAEFAHPQKGNLDRAEDKLEEGSEKTEAALAADDPKEQTNELAQAAQEMKNKVEEARQIAERVETQLAREAAQQRQELLKEFRQAPEQEVADARHEAQNLDSQADRAKEKMADDPKVAEAAEEAATQLEATARQLEETAEIYDASPITDAQEAADAAHLAQALDALAEDVAEASTPEETEAVKQQAEALERAQDALAAAAQTEELAESLEEMRAAESEAAQTGEESTVGADDLQVAELGLEELPRNLQEAGAEQETVKAAQDAERSPEARALEHEQRERARPDAPENQNNAEVAENLAGLEEQVEAVREQLQEGAEAARELLAEAAPSLPEAIRDIAEEAAEAARESVATADAADTGEASPQETTEAAEDLLAQQAETEQALEALQDALRYEADAADLDSQEGRQEARAPTPPTKACARPRRRTRPPKPSPRPPSNRGIPNSRRSRSVRPPKARRNWPRSGESGRGPRVRRRTGRPIRRSPGR